MRLWLVLMARGSTDHFAEWREHWFDSSRKMVGVAKQQEDECECRASTPIILRRDQPDSMQIALTDNFNLAVFDQKNVIGSPPVDGWDQPRTVAP